MTWYTVEHACGDTERHQITGSNAANRNWRAEGLRGTDCSECQNRQREIEKAARNAAAAAAAAEQGLPELTGTELQVPWAITIRAEALGVLDAIIDYIDEPIERATPRADAKRRAVEIYRQIYLATTEAKTWIDLRDWASRPGDLARRFATHEQHKAELAELEARPHEISRLASLAMSRRNFRRDPGS